MQVRQELRDFSRQRHSPRRQGDLLMMVLADKVWAHGLNMFDMAHMVLARPETSGGQLPSWSMWARACT